MFELPPEKSIIDCIIKLSKSLDIEQCKAILKND